MYRGYGFLSFPNQAIADNFLQRRGYKPITFGAHCSLWISKSYQNEERNKPRFNLDGKFLFKSIECAF
jgi:hypothetical protein